MDWRHGHDCLLSVSMLSQEVAFKINERQVQVARLVFLSAVVHGSLELSSFEFEEIRLQLTIGPYPDKIQVVGRTSC